VLGLAGAFAQLGDFVAATETGLGPLDDVLSGGLLNSETATAAGSATAAEGAGVLAEGADFGLPGGAGTAIPGRLSGPEMAALSDKYGVEFAQVYRTGDGPGGAGGQYYLYSGEARSVRVPVGDDVRLISHTHPGGTAYASSADMRLLDVLQSTGSPQQSSEIVLPSGQTFRFGGAYGRSGAIGP
jgi:hypothetical protein